MPAWRGQGTVQQLRRVVLDEDLGLKIQASREAEIFMGGTRIAIDTTVLTPAVRVNTIDIIANKFLRLPAVHSKVV